MSTHDDEVRRLQSFANILADERDAALVRAQKAEARLAALGVTPDGPPPTLSEVTVDKIVAAEAKTKEVYRERDMCVALIARLAHCYGLHVGLGRHPDGQGWDWDWMTIVFIDLPSGQISWHVHDSEVWMFQSLPKYTEPWDGHDTELKYKRVVASGLDARAPVTTAPWTRREREIREALAETPASERDSADVAIGDLLDELDRVRDLFRRLE